MAELWYCPNCSEILDDHYVKIVDQEKLCRICRTAKIKDFATKRVKSNVILFRKRNNG